VPRQRARKQVTGGASSATVGYEAQLWQMADALRGSMDAAEYKKGLSPRNLKHMRVFAAARPERPIVQEPLARIPLDHNRLGQVLFIPHPSIRDSPGSRRRH
jgi:hypothetical protein